MNFLARQKFRFDQAQGFLPVIYITLLVISASDKIALVFNVSTRVMVLILVPVVLIAVWAAGYALVRLRFPNAYQAQMNQTNEMLKEALRK